MSKSIKFKNNNYLDSSSISHKKKLLSEILNGLTSYSTEEQVIGTWIDGKKVYRKVVSGTTPSEKGDFYAFSIPTLDTLISLTGIINNWIPFNSLTSEGYMSALYKDDSATTFSISIGNRLYNYPYIAIIEYTKTTD